MKTKAPKLKICRLHNNERSYANGVEVDPKTLKPIEDRPSHFLGSLEHSWKHAEDGSVCFPTDHIKRREGESSKHFQMRLDYARRGVHPFPPL